MRGVVSPSDVTLKQKHIGRCYESCIYVLYAYSSLYCMYTNVIVCIYMYIDWIVCNILYLLYCTLCTFSFPGECKRSACSALSCGVCVYILIYIFLYLLACALYTPYCSHSDRPTVHVRVHRVCMYTCVCRSLSLSRYLAMFLADNVIIAAVVHVYTRTQNYWNTFRFMGKMVYFCVLFCVFLYLCRSVLTYIAH